MADLHVRQASRWSTTLYAAAALDDGMPGRGRRRRWRRHMSHAQRGRSPTARYRCSAGSRSPRSIPRTGSCGGSSSASSSSATPLTTSASSAAKRCAAGGPLRREQVADVSATDELGFNDPTAQRLERDHHRRRPGDRRADARRHPARPALAGIRRRAHLRRQVKPDLPRGLRRRGGHPAAPASRPHPSHRS